MKNIFKTSKRTLAAILTLCILLGIAGTCIYAASAMPEENTTVTEETTVVAEETTHELVPVMASECGIGGWNGGYPGDDGSVAPGAGWEWRGGGAPGSNAGSWIIPNTLYYLWGHMANNGGGHGPHWDYRNGNGTWYRIFPDGRYEPK